MARPIRYRTGFTLFALFFASVLAFLDRQLLNILVGPIRTEVGISDVQFSMLQGMAFAVVYFAAAFPVATLSDRFSRKQVIVVSILAWSAMTLLFGLAGGFTLLLLARMGVALGEAGLSPASISILRQIYPEHRQSFAVAMLTVSVYLGGGLSMAIGGPALTALDAHGGPLPFGLTPWRLMFVACAILGLVGVLFLLAMPEPKREPIPRGEVSLVEFLRAIGMQRGRVAAYLAAGTGLTAVVYAIMAWTPAMLMRSYGWSPARTGLVYGMVYIAGGIVGALLSGRLVGHIARRGSPDAVVVVMRWACLLVGAATMLAVVAPNGVVAIVLTGLAMIAVGALIALNAYG